MNNNLNITNDITSVDKESLLDKINTYSRFSLSFFILLIASTIICSLGLLMNSAPVVIGGMIIAPLMWPLMKITAGISLGRKKIVFEALFLFGFSIVAGQSVAFLITFLSPVKAINNEILARIQPTILDLIIALAAGGVAALGIAKKKISDSLSGVAIATSLMPPLCVSGIGLALWNLTIASGAFLLFLSNVISIIFAASITFILLGVRLKKGKPFTLHALSLIGIIFIMLSIQLFIFFQNYSFQTTAHQETQKILTKAFTDINHLIVAKNIKTTVGATGKNIVSIEADILIPEQINIDYAQKQKIIKKLEEKLNKQIELNLHIQRTIALESEDEKTIGDKQKKLQQAFRNAIESRKGSISIETLDIYQHQYAKKWIINATLIGDPDAEFSEIHRNLLEQLLSNKIAQPVILNIDLITRVKLKSFPEMESQQIRQEIQQFLTTKNNNITISIVRILQPEKDKVTIKLELKIPKSFPVSSFNISKLKKNLETKYKKTFLFDLDVIEKNSYSL